MSDEKRDAHNLYVQYLAVSADNIGSTDSDIVQQLEEARGKISMLILQFLCQCRPQERFRHTEFTNVIALSSRMDSFDADKAVEAFFNLEQYLLLLCLMPWKQEYHKLKKYGGFYQCKIESHLGGAESIFRLIGFTERIKGLLMWTHTTKTEVIQYVAFECFCAAVECKIISEIWRRTCHGRLRLSEVVNIRLQTAGSTDIVVAFIESKYGVHKHMVAMNAVDCGKKVEDKKPLMDRSPTDTFRNKLQEHIKTAQKLSSGKDIDPDIPFMDDDTKEQDLTPGNFNDHLMASLKIVGDKEASPEINTDQVSGMRPSQEWSFVREGLERNYGKKYFEGPPKDLTSGEKQIDYMNKPPSFQNNVNDLPIQGAFRPVSTSDVPVYTGVDSAYDSASTMFNTPKYPEGQYVQHTLIPRRHDLDVIKRGTSFNLPAPKSSKTEPILRRPADRDVSSISHSATLSSGNTDNIKKMQKRSSLPVGPKDRVTVPHGTFNVSQQSSISNNYKKNVPDLNPLGSQSFNGNLGRNVRDGVNGLDLGSRSLGQKVGPVWNCTHCTYSNFTDSMICTMCAKSREVTEMDSPQAGTQLRVCEKCTLENSTDSLVCNVCGNQLKNTQTVV